MTQINYVYEQQVEFRYFTFEPFTYERYKLHY